MNILEMIKNEKVEWRKLGEVCEDKFWIMPKTPKFNEEYTIPYITGKNIKNWEINFDNVSYISEEDYNRMCSGRKILKNDILISMIGTIGEIACVNTDVKFYGQNLYLIRLNNKIILNRFFYHFFSQSDIQNLLISKKNISSQGYIKAGQIENILIPIPSLETQEKIVKTLDKFTKYVTELQAELQAELHSREKQYEFYREKVLSEKYITKLMSKLSFDEKDNLLNITTLGDIGFFTRGNGLQKKDFVEKGFPVVHYGEIYTKYNFSTDKVYTYTDEITYSKLRKAQKNDILIATTSENFEDVGKSVVWLGEEEIGFSGDMYSYRTTQNPKYIAYLFQTNMFRKFKESKVSGTKVIRLHSNELEKMRVVIPSLKIQDKIVKILDSFQESISNTKGLLPKEIELRQKQYEYYREKLLTFDGKCDNTHTHTHTHTDI